MRTTQSENALAELAGTLTGRVDLVDFLHRLTDRSLGLLSVDAAAILLRGPAGRLQTWASSSHVSELLDLMESQADGGPCLSAVRAGEPITPPDLEALRSWWPSFSLQAESMGFTAVHAVPVQSEAEVFGAFTVLTVREGPLRGHRLHLAQALAALAAAAVSTDHAAQHRVRADHLRQALASKVVLEQAKGVLAERKAIHPDQAYDLIRDTARRDGRTLTQVAAEVVANRGRPPG